MNEGISIEEIFPTDLLGVSLSFFWPPCFSNCLDVPLRSCACPGLVSSLYVNKRWNHQAHKLLYEYFSSPCLRVRMFGDSFGITSEEFRESFALFWRRTKWNSLEIPISCSANIILPLLDGAIEGSQNEPTFSFQSLTLGRIDDMKAVWERIQPANPLFSTLKKLDLGGWNAMDSIIGLLEYLRTLELMGTLDECQLQVVDVQSPPFDDRTSRLYEEIVRLLPPTLKLMNLPQYAPADLIEKILRKFPLLEELPCNSHSTHWTDLPYFDGRCLSILAEMKHWKKLDIAVHHDVTMDQLFELLRKVVRNSPNLETVDLAFEENAFDEWLGDHNSTGKACRYVKSMVEDDTDDYNCWQICVERMVCGYDDDYHSVQVEFLIQRKDDFEFGYECEYSQSHESDCSGCLGYNPVSSGEEEFLVWHEDVDIDIVDVFGDVWR